MSEKKEEVLIEYNVYTPSGRIINTIKAVDIETARKMLRDLFCPDHTVLPKP